MVSCASSIHEEWTPVQVASPDNEVRRFTEHVCLNKDQKKKKNSPQHAVNFRKKKRCTMVSNFLSIHCKLLF